MADPAPDDKTAEVEQRIQRYFERELRACGELDQFTDTAMTPWKGRPIRKHAPGEPPGADEIVAFSLARSTKTYRAALQLARQGYGEQAAMLNRSLFEGMAVAHWVHPNEDTASERFNRAFGFDQYLLARLLEATGWIPEEEHGKLGPEFDEDELKQMEADFGKYGEKLWTGHRNIRELVADIEDQWTTEEDRQVVWNFLRIAHRDNNQLLHSTVSGLAGAVSNVEPDGLSLSVGPSTARIEKGLFAAYWSHLNMLGLVIERFEMPAKDDFNDLIDRQQYDFRRLSRAEVKDVGRNDPCPCGSGLKYKLCHEAQVKAAG